MCSFPYKITRTRGRATHLVHTWISDETWWLQIGKPAWKRIGSGMWSSRSCPGGRDEQRATEGRWRNKVTNRERELVRPKDRVKTLIWLSWRARSCYLGINQVRGDSRTVSSWDLRGLGGGGEGFGYPIQYKKNQVYEWLEKFEWRINEF